jgi:hypothetical protein
MSQPPAPQKIIPRQRCSGERAHFRWHGLRATLASFAELLAIAFVDSIQSTSGVRFLNVWPSFKSAAYRPQHFLWERSFGCFQ